MNQAEAQAQAPTKIMRAWITWPDGSSDGWYHCQLLLENGWPIYAHLCSHPGFAAGDLWERRTERQEDWRRAGLQLEIVDAVPHSELPPEVLARNKEGSYAAWAKENFPSDTQEKSEQPKETK